MSNSNENSKTESPKVTHDALKNLCENNAAFFEKDESEYGQRLHKAFTDIIKHINAIGPMVNKINSVAKHYDFDEDTPGNGFRSFLTIVDSSISYGLQLSHKVCLKRDNLLFRKGNMTREIENCCQLFENVSTCLQHLITLTKWCPFGELFPSAEHSPEELLNQAETINQYCFYGRCLGFQYCESMRNILKFISLAMAIFSEAYYNNGSFFSKATSSFFISGKYMINPEIRARRVVNISQNADVDFCKAFWCLTESELMHHINSKFVATSVAVSNLISIPPEPLIHEKSDGAVVEIPIPSAHVGTKPLHVRLISYVVREGMVGVGNRLNVSPPSPGLIVHCHGGGFVAQSSRSHETYLRDWAMQLKVPILSIDYSLAPAAPFPRALEEVYYAYNWAVKNCHLLGSTGEKILMAGDSAGANLCIGATLKSIEHDTRIPDGLFLAYVPTLIGFEPSPARMLCIMDPLLPFGFMMRCLKAYACPDPSLINKNDMDINLSSGNCVLSPDTESFEEVSESDLLELQAHKSPVSETSDTLTNVSLSSQPSDSSKTAGNTITENKNATSEKYVTEFLEKYVLDSDTDSDGNRVPVLRDNLNLDESSSENEKTIQNDPTFQQKFAGFVGALTQKLTIWKNRKRFSDAELFLDADRQKSLVEEFKFSVPKDPYLSPYWAKDEILKQLPPIKILTVQLDPCLDDCVMFAKKLKRLGNNVGLDILEGLPHGFLNFSLVCKEAHQGSKLCVQRISNLLNLDTFPDISAKKSPL